MKPTQYILYKIHWPGTGFFYIGKTRGFRKRRNRHLRELKDGTHYNCKLLYAYGLHGVPEIDVVRYFKTNEALDIGERTLLARYCKRKKFCNIQLA